MDSHTGRIVAAVDGSDTAGTALDWAAHYARASGMPLTVLHVAEYGLAAPPLPWLPELAELTASSITCEAVERARAAGVQDVRAVHVADHAATHLITVSEQAAMLVLGNRGLGEFMGAALGSVAYTVSAHAHCPVVLIREGVAVGPAELPGPDRPVVVGVDGSEISRAAVRFAADVAAGQKARLVVAASYRSAMSQAWTGRALSTLADAPVLETEGSVTFDELVRTVGEHAAAEAAEAAARRQPGIELAEQVVEGPPIRALIEAGRGAGLLVVGSRGHGTFAGAILGSVSHGVVHAAPCPVAVVRDYD